MAPPQRYPDAAARQRAYRLRQAQARQAEQHAKGLPPHPPIPTLPSTARWHALLTQAHHLLQMTQEEMQTYAADRSERWQHSQRAEEFDDRMAVLEHLLEDLTELLS